MPNKPRHIPGYKLHKPSGQARVIIRGRQIYLGRYGSPESQERYGRIIAEYAAGATATPQPAGPKPAGENLLVVELVAAYWEFAGPYYVKDGKPTAHLHAVRRALSLLRQLYGKTPAVEFGPAGPPSSPGQPGGGRQVQRVRQRHLRNRQADLPVGSLPGIAPRDGLPGPGHGARLEAGSNGSQGAIAHRSGGR